MTEDDNEQYATVDQFPWIENINNTVEEMHHTLQQIDAWEQENRQPIPTWANPLLSRKVFHDIINRLVALEAHFKQEASK